MAAEDTVRGATKSSNYASMGTPNTGVTYTADNPWVQFISQTGDPTSKALAFQQIKSMLENQPAPAGSKYSNMLTYTQAQIRFVGASKDKTPIGMIGPGDATAFAKIAQSAVDNGWSFNEYLNTWAKYATPPAAKVKDTSTTYNKQVSTALLLKDEGDARVAWNNAYFTAYGSYPPEASNATFKNAWNSQVKSQASTSSTQYVISYEPVLDKNGKQVLDKLGKPSYNAVTKSTTSSTGEGFTVPEQQQFLSDYLVKNHPSSTWDIKTLGGQAKTMYDDLISTISANYGATQDLSTLGPVIAQALGNADPKVSAEVIKKFKDCLLYTSPSPRD